VHVEREIAAAALDEVAMALAAEGDANASAAVAGMALRVAAAESPKKIRLDALANLSNTLSTNLGSNALVSNATDRRTEKAGSLGSAEHKSVAADRAPAAGERASPGESIVSARTPTTTPFSFRSDSNRNGSSAGLRSFGKSVSSSAGSADARSRSRDGSPSHESFAASAFEMAARAAAMGDDPEGLTSDEEAEEVELAERRRAAAAAAAAAAEAERMQAANEAALAAAAAAGATAARRASFDEWAAAAASREGVSTGAADDAASVSSYHGSLDDYSSDSGSDVSDVEAATGAASAWLAKTRARMRLSPTKSGGSFFSPSRRRAGDATETDGKDERDADDARETRTTGKNGEDGFLFDRANVTVDLAPERPERSGVTASPIGREAERRARESASSAEDGGGAPRAPSPSAPPTLRLEVLSGVSRGDAVSAPPGVELLTVGRGDARDLCVGDVEVSSSHAEFRWTWFTAFPAGDAGAADAGAGAGADALFGADDAGRARLGEWRVADVGSTNGTFLNGDAVHGSGGRGRNANPWRALRHGDEIRLGERAESPALRVSLVHETDPTRARDANTTANTANTASHGVHERSHVRAFEPCLFLRSSARVDPGKPPRMEDRSLSECPLRGCADVALFAVFDGHAGADAAERARRVFPEVLAKRLGHCAPRGHGDAPGDAANALRDAFLETDANIACEYEGCSAAVLLVWRCDATGGVYAQTANVGDAGIVLGRTRGHTVSDARANPDAHLVTRAHVLADPAERARFVAAGASVAEGTNETVRGLRVSRSVGDAFLKRELPGLVATPYVSAPIFMRGDGNDVAVLATRGLWRVADAREAAEAATSSPGGGEKSKSVRRRWAPAAGAARLVELARRRRSREDVAVVVVRLEQATGTGGSAE
jgi:protein phosphatase